MKLIFVNRYFWPDESATSQMVSNLCVALAERGWEVHAVTSRRLHRGTADALKRRDQIAGVTIHRIWTAHIGGTHLAGRAAAYLSFYLTALWRLLLLTRPGDVLIAATDPPLLSLLTWVLAAFAGAVRINWMQDLFPEVAVELGVVRPGIEQQLLGYLRDRSLRHAAMNVAIGERMATYLERRGTPWERLTVIHNWSDGEAVRR